MENIKIRKMKLNDLEKIKDILEIEFDDFWNYNVLKGELNNSNSLYFVAECNGKIQGFAGLINNVDFVEISNIVVKKDCRNNGIGKKLLDKIINESKKLEKDYIYLEVNEENKIAIKLYEKEGFIKVGIRKKYYNNEFDAILMNLKIN